MKDAIIVPIETKPTHNFKIVTMRDLRKATENLPDSAELVIWVQYEDGLQATTLKYIEVSEEKWVNEATGEEGKDTFCHITID